MTAQPLSELVHPGWVPILAPVAGDIAALGDFLRAELASGRGYLPPGEKVLRAFSGPPDQVRVLILGQDPYPTPGHAVGLSFSVAPQVRPLPRSLTNIFKEYCADLSLPVPTSGDLTPWFDRGVLLLNRVLTVQPGRPGSHRGRGWERVTAATIAGLVRRERPLVAILWGRDAQTAQEFLGDTPVIASAHPSPMSADRGFFGSRPFTRANTLLAQRGGEPVDWQLP